MFKSIMVPAIFLLKKKKLFFSRSASRCVVQNQNTIMNVLYVFLKKYIYNLWIYWNCHELKYFYWYIFWKYPRCQYFILLFWNHYSFHLQRKWYTSCYDSQTCTTFSEDWTCSGFRNIIMKLETWIFSKNTSMIF